MLCLCGSGKNSLQCCQRYLSGHASAETPEALMRSRYTAYASANIDYIIKTMRDEALIGFDKKSALDWAKSVTWIGLKVIATHLDSPQHGNVEFEASFIKGKTLQCIHERSAFLYHDNHWYYTHGQQLPPQHPQANTLIGRNMMCPCGSQRKFKYCHG